MRFRLREEERNRNASGRSYNGGLVRENVVDGKGKKIIEASFTKISSTIRHINL
jgi:hypothetical protein